LNFIKSQKTLIFLTGLIVVVLGWHNAGQTSFIYSNELKVKFALLSIAYVSLLSAVASLVLGGLAWFLARRKFFVPVFAVCAVILFTNNGPGREIGPRYVLPPLMVKYEWVYHTLPHAYLNELQAGPEYGFRKVRWEMSPEQVKKAETPKAGEETAYPDGKINTLVYSGVECLGFECNLEYLFENGQLIAASYSLLPGQDYGEFKRKFEEVYGEYAFRFKLDNMERHFWDVGGSEIYLEMPVSAKNENTPKLHFISKQYAGFFNQAE